MSVTAAFATLKDAPHAQWVADVLKADTKLAADVKTYGVKLRSNSHPCHAEAARVPAVFDCYHEGVADIKRVVYEMKRKESATETSGILAGMRMSTEQASP